MTKRRYTKIISPMALVIVIGIIPLFNANASDETLTMCEKASAATRNPIHLAEDEWVDFLCQMSQLGLADQDKALENFTKRQALNQPIWIRRREIESKVSPDVLASAPQEDPLLLVVPRERRNEFITATGRKPFLGPGPIVRLRPDSNSNNGHYGATYQSLKRVMSDPSPASANYDPTRLAPDVAYPWTMYEVMADASQDADFYEWEHPAAHAQTPCDEEGNGEAQPCAGMPRDCAKQKFIDWTGEQIRKAFTACRADNADPTVVLYWVGYSLHSIQDLAAHKGRTNAEHSHNSYKQKDCNPDTRAENMELAVDMGVRYLALVGKELDADASCRSVLSKIQTTSVIHPHSMHWKAVQHGHGWTILKHLARYRGLATKYARLREQSIEAPIRWFDRGTICDRPAKPLVACHDDVDCEAILKALVAKVQQARNQAHQ